MKRLSSLSETYIREEPARETPPKSDLVQQIEEFADKEDLDQEMRAVYDVLDDGGFIYASFEHSFWIKVKRQGKLVRVM